MKLFDKMCLVVAAVALGVQWAVIYLAAGESSSPLALVLMGIVSSLGLVAIVAAFWLAKGGKFRQQ